MHDHTFQSENFNSPQVTISISKLWEALVSQTLGTTKWRTSSVRKEKYKRKTLSDKAIESGEVKIIQSLSSASLIAHVYNGNNFDLIRIPPSYWAEESAQMSLHGHLFDINPGRSYPITLDGCAVVIVEANAVSWLAEQAIFETSEFYPKELLPRPQAAKAPLPPDEKIVAQMKKMRASGQRRDEIVQDIRKTPGFKSVTNEHARLLYKTNFKRGRPPKNRDQK